MTEGRPRFADWLLYWTDRLRWYLLGLIIFVYLIGFTGVRIP